jgi:hypothetical protein
MTREEIPSCALNELQLFFPEVKRARLVKSGVLKEARATFSVVPGLDQFRPPQATEWGPAYTLRETGLQRIGPRRRKGQSEVGGLRPEH